MIGYNMRAIRRHHRERLKKKRIEYYGGWMKKSHQPKIERRIGVAIDTPTLYSKPQCHGNQRYYCKGDEKLTIQEQRAEYPLRNHTGIPGNITLKTPSSPKWIKRGHEGGVVVDGILDLSIKTLIPCF